MTESVKYLTSSASEAQIVEHLGECDVDFVPPLSGRLRLRDYASKIASRAITFEAWSGETLIGLVATYYNDPGSCNAYITSVSVLRHWTGKGIAAQLLGDSINYAKRAGMRQIGLEVASSNVAAIKLYEKSGFNITDVNGPFLRMHLSLRTDKI